MEFYDPTLVNLLDHALKITDEHDREAWMRKVCGDDHSKYEELRSLIEASRKTVYIDTPLEAVQEGSRLLESLEGQTVGPYKILREIGVGGMGAVYLARQQRPVTRLVAIKLIHQNLESRPMLERFRTEQQMLAIMDHPNIAKIYDAGETESGYMYIAMEYVDGDRVFDYCSKANLTVREKIQLMLQCCRAIQHAHQKGTIHRDIKPSNVMVTVVDDEPVIKVIDFGIAKATDSENRYEAHWGSEETSGRMHQKTTSTGISPGTPRYMSPEQFLSGFVQIDTRSDIYSLGALLYHLLTGCPPFEEIDIDGMSLTELRDYINQHDPRRPSEKCPEKTWELRGDLDAIIHKAMQRDIEQRYQSVAQFHDDLRNHLSGNSVEANRGSTWTEIIKFSKRNKVLIGSVSLSVLGILIGWGLSYVQEKRAIRSEILARRQAYASDLLLASTVASRGNHALSKSLLDRHRVADRVISDVNTTKHSHRIDWRILASQVPSQPLSLAQFPTKNYFGIYLAMNQELACGSKDSHLRILDSSTGNLRLDIDTGQGEINGLALSPDGLTIATGGDDGTVKFWDWKNGQLLNQFDASGDHVFQIGWSGDGKHFVTVGDEPDAKIWTYPSLGLQRTIPTDGELLECLAIGPEGQIAVGSDKGVIRITTADTLDLALDQKIAATMSRGFHVNRCSSLAFSHTGRLMASGLDNGYLILFRRNRSEYEIVERLRFPTNVTSIVFTEDERSLAIGENNGSVHVLKLPAVWPTTSKLRFTKFFLDENSKTLQDPTGDPSALWDVVRKVEPSDARDRIPLDVDRVYIEFSKPMKNVLLSDNFIREWTDENGNFMPTWNEIPSNTIYKENGIELQFENRHSGWSTMNDLQIQGRLTSWSYHSKRVASLAWDGSSGGIYSFSEDGHVKRKMVDEVQSVNLGGGNIGSVIPMKNRRLVLSTPDDRSRVISLAPKSNEVTKSQFFDEGHVSWNCFVEYGEVVYFVKEIRGSSGADKNYLYAWDFATDVSRAVSQFPTSIKVRTIIGAISEERIALQIESEESENIGLAQSFQIACWDMSHQRIVWETQKRRRYARLTKASLDGHRLAYNFDGVLYLADTRNGDEKRLEDLAGVEIQSVCFSPNSEFLAVAVSDNTIRCFHTSSGRFLWTIQTPGSPSVDLVWSKDLITLLTVAQDGFLRAFDTTLQQMTIEVPLTTKNPIRVRLSPEDDWIYILDRDGTLIQLPSGEP